MIALLHGMVRHKKAPFLIIECSGVGYEVETTLTAFAKLPDINEKTIIYTHLSIRDDAHVLFGFASLNERDLFRVLIKVSGIGPKMAIAILSGMNPDELAGVIAAEDSTALTKLPGIGKKTAERLIVELKDKFKHTTLTTSNSGTPGHTDRQTKNDAIEALVQLGYKTNEAEKMVESVYQADINSSELIRLALQAKLKAKR